MDLEDPDDFLRLSEVVKGFSNNTRLALLIGFYHNYTANEVADFLDMTRGGLQNNINKMVSSDLVYRPSKDNEPTYRLTPLGEFFAQFFDTYSVAALDALDEFNRTRDQVAQDVEDSPVVDSLGQSERKKLIHTTAWENVRDEIAARLAASEDVITSPGAAHPGRGRPRGFAFESHLSAEEIEKLLDEDHDEKDSS